MTIMLETKRLILRPPTFNDTEELVSLLNNFNISRMTGRIPFPYAAADAQAFIENCDRSNDRMRLVVLSKATNTLIGGVGIRSDELGYWIGEPFWGDGFASEAASVVVSHFFQVEKRELLRARWRADNPASGRVLEKLGFERIDVGTGDSTETAAAHPLVDTILTRKRWLLQ